MCLNSYRHTLPASKKLLGQRTGGQRAQRLIGVFRVGFNWVLDLNCDGQFSGTGKNDPDANFNFGGIPAMFRSR